MKLSTKRTLTFIPSAIFSIVIFIPFFLSWTIFKQDSFPHDFLSNEYPKKFDKFYQDHLPERAAILSRYAAFRRDIFKVNEKVLFGEKEWLFYKAEEDGNTIFDFTGVNLFNPKQLEDFLSEGKCTVQWLGVPQAQVLFLLPPNKSQVYFELMPEFYRPQRAESGRLEQVEKALSSQGLEVVSVKQDLLGAKGLGQLYYRTDSHWNSLGAFVAFKRLMKKIEPNAQFNPDWEPIKYFCGDIYANMLGLKESCEDVDYVDRSEKISWQNLECERDRNNSNNKDILRKCVNPQSPNPKTVLLVGDSYFDALAPFFANHFGKVYSLDRKKNKSQIREVLDKEKPDIIVIDSVERYIPDLFAFSDCVKK